MYRKEQHGAAARERHHARAARVGDTCEPKRACLAPTSGTAVRDRRKTRYRAKYSPGQFTQADSRRWLDRAALSVRGRPTAPPGRSLAPAPPPRSALSVAARASSLAAKSHPPALLLLDRDARAANFDAEIRNAVCFSERAPPGGGGERPLPFCVAPLCVFGKK